MILQNEKQILVPAANEVNRRRDARGGFPRLACERCSRRLGRMGSFSILGQRAVPEGPRGKRNIGDRLPAGQLDEEESPLGLEHADRFLVQDGVLRPAGKRRANSRASAASRDRTARIGRASRRRRTCGRASSARWWRSRRRRRAWARRKRPRLRRRLALPTHHRRAADKGHRPVGGFVGDGGHRRRRGSRAIARRRREEP